MGVSGCGKSSLALAIAQDQGGNMLEGDAFHPATSQEKMTKGIPLTDQDRTGWLQSLGKALAQSTASTVVLSCSALKKKLPRHLAQLQTQLALRLPRHQPRNRFSTRLVPRRGRWSLFPRHAGRQPVCHARSANRRSWRVNRGCECALA